MTAAGQVPSRPDPRRDLRRPPRQHPQRAAPRGRAAAGRGRSPGPASGRAPRARAGQRDAGQATAGPGDADRGDAEAATWLARAARQAAATSPDVAAGLLDRAIGLTHPADPGRDRLLAERADSLMLAGRVPSALAACRDLLGRPHDPDVDGQVQVCLAHALLAQGQVRDARDELERACQSPGLSAAARIAAQAWAGFARISLGDLDGAAASVAAVRDGGGAAGDHLVTSITMATMARVAESRRAAPGGARPRRRGRAPGRRQPRAGWDTASRSASPAAGS